MEMVQQHVVAKAESCSPFGRQSRNAQGAKCKVISLASLNTHGGPSKCSAKPASPEITKEANKKYPLQNGRKYNKV